MNTQQQGSQSNDTEAASENNERYKRSVLSEKQQPWIKNSTQKSAEGQ